MNIVAAGTSITAMIGRTSSGPVNEAMFIQSFSDFVNNFGVLQPTLELGYSVMLYFANGGNGVWIVRQSSSMDAALTALDAVPALNLLCAPGISDPATQAAIVAYAEKRAAFALLDVESAAASAQALIDYAQNPATTKSECAALYGPWIQMHDPIGGKTRTTASSGAVAAIFARQDNAKGVWKAPAGTNADILDATGLAFAVSAAEMEAVENAGVNIIRTVPNFGIVVWGARTRTGVADEDGTYKYVAVKRLTLFLQQSLQQGLQWVVFDRMPRLFGLKSQSRRPLFCTAFLSKAHFKAASRSRHFM